MQFNRFLFVFIFLFSVVGLTMSHAQDCYRMNSNKGSSIFSVGIGGGLTFPHTDISQQNNREIFELNAMYTPSKYLHIYASGAKGWISAGKEGTSYMELDETWFFKNNFWTANLLLRLRVLPLFGRESLNPFLPFDVYVGTGITYLNSYTLARVLVDESFGSLGSYQGNDFLVPAEVGVFVPFYTVRTNNQSKNFAPFFSFNFNFRYHVSFSDKLDAYVPNVPSNKFNDSYNTATLSLVYTF